MEMKKKESQLHINGEGEFSFPNLDKYIGGFQASRSGTIIRQGFGEYTTWDGHAFRGYWENDILLPDKEVYINYCDGSKYQGYIDNFKYSGCGIYTFPDKSSLKCLFEKNEPEGDVEFIDKSGFYWVGNVRDMKLTFVSCNKFYSSCVDLVEKIDSLSMLDSTAGSLIVNTSAATSDIDMSII